MGRFNQGVSELWRFKFEGLWLPPRFASPRTAVLSHVAASCARARVMGIFYPRDAMLARYFLCLSVSVTSRCSIETAGRIELILTMVFFDLSIVHCGVRTFRYIQNNVTSPAPQNIVIKIGLRKVRHHTPITAACFNLARQPWSERLAG